MKDFNRAIGFAGMITELGGRKPSIFSKIVTAIGTIAALSLAIILYIYQDSVNPSPTILTTGTICYAVVILSIFLLGVRYLAIAKNGAANVKSVGGVFLRVFLWMYLPAIVLTILLTGVAFLFGAFNN